jgi:hypothetical protein
MYPLNATAYLKQLQTFNPLKEKKAAIPTLPCTLTKPMEVEVHLTK